MSTDEEVAAHAKSLTTEGYTIVRGFLDRNALPDGFQDFIHIVEKTPKFGDGVIYADGTAASQVMVDRSTALLHRIGKAAGLNNGDSGKNEYQTGQAGGNFKGGEYTQVAAILVDPTVVDCARAWHLDHVPYFRTRNHHDFISGYMPIVKPNRHDSNLAFIPYDVLEREDHVTYARLKGRGAMHFVQVQGEAQRKHFQRVFDNQHNCCPLTEEKPTVVEGDWLAVDGAPRRRRHAHSSHETTAQPRCSRDAAAVQTRCMRDAAAIQPQAVLIQPSHAIAPSLSQLRPSAG